MDSRILVGRKIREIRKKLNITQDLFSEKLDIDTSTLSNIERGLSYPSMPTLLNIINVFKIKPDDLFRFDYLKDEINFENEMIEIIKKQPYEKKQILYRIIKQFAI